MTRFHVHPVTGEPGRCRARIHSCPFGSDENHFDTPEEARSFYEKFAESLLNPKETARFHFIEDEEGSAFTEGDCAHLARALYQKTGWPLLVVSAKADVHSPVDIDWSHMAVRSPDGRILDVYGLWKEEDFLKEWESSYWKKHGGGALTQVAPKNWKVLEPEPLQFSSSPTKTANKIVKVLESFGLTS